MELNIKMCCTNEEIKERVTELSKEIEQRKSEIDLLRTALDVYRRQCKHIGQKTGYNERDGSWGNPCPTCGYSY